MVREFKQSLFGYYSFPVQKLSSIPVLGNRLLKLGKLVKVISSENSFLLIHLTLSRKLKVKSRQVTCIIRIAFDWDSDGRGVFESKRIVQLEKTKES